MFANGRHSDGSRNGVRPEINETKIVKRTKVFCLPQIEDLRRGVVSVT